MCKIEEKEGKRRERKSEKERERVRKRERVLATKTVIFFLSQFGSTLNFFFCEFPMDYSVV